MLSEEQQRQLGAGRAPEEAEPERRGGRKWRWSRSGEGGAGGGEATRSEDAATGAERCCVRGPPEVVVVVEVAVEAKRGAGKSAARADGRGKKKVNRV